MVWCERCGEAEVCLVSRKEAYCVGNGQSFLLFQWQCVLFLDVCAVCYVLRAACAVG